MENTNIMNTHTHTLKWKVLSFLLLLGWMGVCTQARAASWTGTQTSGTYTLDGNVHMTSGITLTGNLTINIGSSGHTIFKEDFDGPLFRVPVGYTLKIIGESGKVIQLNGQMTYNTANDARSGVPTNCQVYKGCGIFAEGSVVLEYVVIRNFWNTTLGKGSLYYDGRGAAILSRNETADRTTIRLTHVSIYGCGSRMGPAFCAWSTDNHSCTFTDVKIYHCWSRGATNSDNHILADGIIRTTGGARTTMTLSECDIYENKSTGPDGSGRGGGGGITWENCDQLTIQKGTKIHNNVAEGEGGGVAVEGKITIKGETDYVTKIYNNTCGQNGGGIFLGTYTGGSSGYDGEGTQLNIGSNVEISGNTANERGGGIYMVIQPSNDVGFKEKNTAISPEFYLKITGGKVYNNKALRGAGIAIVDYAPNKHKYNNKWTGEYKRNVTISSGSVYGNTTLTNNANLDPRGAGIYIFKAKYDKITNSSFGYTYGTTISGNDKVNAGTLSVTFSGGEVRDNKAYKNQNNEGGDGGGFYIRDDMGNVSPYYSKLNVTASGSSVHNNTSANNGGGFYINNGNVTVNNGNVYSNTGNNGAGIFIHNSTVSISGGNVYSNTASTGNGGGFYISGSTIEKSGGNIYSNSAKNGGGFYITDGTVTNKGGYVYSNTSTNNGGGFFIENGTTKIQGGSIGRKSTDPVQAPNIASNHGGGFYIKGSGSVEINNSSGTPVIADNQAIRGGGLFIESGPTVTISGGNIRYNQAKKKTSDGSGGNGGGIYSYASLTVNNGIVHGNSAENVGGGLLVPNCTATVTFSGGTFSENTASSQGGGVYLDTNSTLDMKGTSQIIDNYVSAGSKQGGGVYINGGATLNLSGTATLSGNHVPEGGNGGGIYMNGTLNLGGGTNPSVKADDNYAGESFSTNTLNNIYLPSASKLVTVVSDISHKTNGVYDTHVGISVEEGHRPVVNVEDPANEPWLNNLMEGITTSDGAVFDDAHYYVAVHTRKDIGPFKKQNIYFWTSWSHAVGTDPEGRESGYPLPEGYTNHYTVDDDGTWHIYTKEGLAWFASYVNGLNGNSPTLNRGTNAVLESDVNMIEHLWVPIGAVTAYDIDDSSYDEDDDVHYTGSFNGQGHVVDSILNGFLTGISRFGLFGSVGGNGTVKNTFLDGYTSIATNSSGDYAIGGISGHLSSGGTISCSEARGEVDATMSSANTCVGGIVGSMGSSTVHSCMAMPDIEAPSQNRVGGLAGHMESGASVKNSFANGKYTNNNNSIGGLAGVISSCTVENCYSRIQGTEEPGNFKWFAGSNSGTVQYCYAPSGKTNYVDGGGTLSGQGNYGITDLVGGKYGFAHSDQQITGGSASYVVNGPIGADGELTGLLATLNKWVGNSTTYARWTRTMGSDINGDYPVLQLGAKNDDEDFVCVGSRDGVFMEYASDLDPMMDAYNAAEGGGSIHLYATPGTVTESNDDDVKVSIAPNVGIQQAVTSDGLSANTLNARVGVVLDNSDGSIEVGGAPYDWHMFSSAIQDVPMGLVYDYEGSTLWQTLQDEGFQSQGVPDEWYHNPVFMDPPKTTWSTENIGYFPTNTPYGTWRGTADPVGSFDFYCYSEPFCHWVNFKRFGKDEAFFDHWHQDKDADGFHANIEYTNEENMVGGKGYLVAVSQPSMLMADGVLNNGNLDVPVTATGYDESLAGVNLIGNPYQSYLDFDAFAAANIEAVNTYYILDADKKGYIAHVMGSSTPLTGGNEQNNNVDGHVVASLANEQYGNDGNTYNFADVASIVDLTAPRYIHPHQGFIVCVDANASVRFGNEMRVTGEALSTFRGGGENHYPMISVICTDDDGLRDYTTMELGRPEAGGGKKVQGLRTGDGSVWFRIDDTDWQTAFTKPGLTEATLCFKAYADGVYTLRWQPANAQFSYLHLIDHITGRDIDCLTTGQYVFEGHASDYKSRFKLVFGYEGGEAPAEPEPVEGQESFAFQMGDQLIVNGEGTLQLFDVSGRCLLEEGTAGSQSAVSLPKTATGVYVLRLIGSDKVKTQKIVISKL